MAMLGNGSNHVLNFQPKQDVIDHGLWLGGNSLNMSSKFVWARSGEIVTFANWDSALKQVSIP